MANFAYLIGCEQTGIGAVIDCGFDAEKILAIATAEALQIKNIFLTHVHYDHSGAAEELAEIEDAAILMNPQSRTKQGALSARGMWIVPSKTQDISAGEIVHCGNLEVEVIAAPGHQNDHFLYKVENYLFTGDTLFIDGVGRTDLPDSDPEALQKTLRSIKNMPDDLMICPGHDYGQVPIRTLGEEKKQNPALLSLR